MGKKESKEERRFIEVKQRINRGQRERDVRERNVTEGEKESEQRENKGQKEKNVIEG